MGEHVDRLEFHQRREAEAGLQVVEEAEEGAAIGPDQSGERQTVHRRGHRVLAHPETEVTRRRAGGVVAFAFEQGVVRAGQVRRAAGEFRHQVLQRIQGGAGGGTGGDRAGCRIEAGQRVAPAVRQRHGQSAVEFSRCIGVLPAVGLEQPAPFRRGVAAEVGRRREGLAGGIGHQELGLKRPAQGLLGCRHFARAQGRAVGGRRVLLVRTAVADVGADLDQGRTAGLRERRVERRGQGLDVIAVVDRQGVPAVGLVAGDHVFREAQVGRAVDRDPVRVVEHVQLAETQVPCHRAGLGGDALHQVAVAGHYPGPMIEQRVAGTVEAGREQLFGDRHADGRRDALAERAGRDLDTGGQAVLGVARGQRTVLPEVPDLVEAQVVAGQVQQAVDQRRGVAAGEHEAVPVRPLGILGRETQIAGPEQGRHRRLAHRRAGMAAVRPFHHVDGEEAQRVRRHVQRRTLRRRSGVGRSGGL